MYDVPIYLAMYSHNLFSAYYNLEFVWVNSERDDHAEESSSDGQHCIGYGHYDRNLTIKTQNVTQFELFFFAVETGN